MTTSTLEERVEALETEVQRLKSFVAKVEGDSQPWWERLAGMFKDDPIFDEIVEAGRNYRESSGVKSK